MAGRKPPLSHDRSQMGKLPESVLAMRFADSTVVDAAKGQFDIGIMRHNIINDDITGMGISQNMLYETLPWAENIENQRTWSGPDDFQNLLRIFISNHREQRAENLFLH